MLRDIPISVYILAAAGGALAGAFTLPALTDGGGTSMAGVSQAAYEQAQETEMDYCRGEVPSVNCACFAHTSGMIIAYESEKPRGTEYKNQRDLARSQARDKC